MFDYEKAECSADDYAEAEWEKITDDHALEEERSGRADARQNNQAATARIYHKISARCKERTGITAVRYAIAAIGLTAVAYLVRNLTGLAIALGSIALALGFTAAYGAGKYREM